MAEKNLSQSKSQSKHSSLTHQHMVRLWTVFAALYGSKFTSQFGTEVDQGGHWLTTLRDVSPEQIAEGLERARTSGKSWPPTAPEFRAMCLKSLSEMPSFAECFGEIVSYVKKSEHRRSVAELSAPVYHAMSNHLDWFSFTRSSSDDQLRQFKTAYELTLADHEAGREIKSPSPDAQLIEKQPEKPADEKTASASINGLKTMFNKSTKDMTLEDEFNRGWAN